MTDVTTLDELKNHGFEPVPEIIWDDIEPLRPGLDFHDGTTFVTVPAKVNIVKTVGKGKAAKEVVEPQDMLVCITSDREQFPFTPERIAQRGFAYPEYVTIDRDRRWSKESIKEFLAGDAMEPDPALLHTGLRKVYEDYVEFAKEEYYDLLPLFVMGSYVFRLYKSVGYLHFNGTAASGKSQNLNILAALGFNTIWSANISAAALYRQLAGNPGLLLIDEAEGWEGERGEDLRRILNAGYLDGSRVHRAEKGPGDVFMTRAYDTFGPKAIASINPLDNVIGSRCLVVAMRPALRKIAEFRRDDTKWQRLRDRLYLWAMFHAPQIEDYIDQWNNDWRYTRAPQLVGRQWQITQMYVTLADYIDQSDGGDRCNRMIAFFNDYFAELQKAQDATDRIRIVLKCLPRVLYNRAPEDGGWYSLKAIHEEVIERLDADAVEYYKTRQVGKHLDVLGFRHKRSRKGGTQVFIDPARVREEFNQRRVEPYDEDREWLAGEIEYVHTIAQPSAPSIERASIWAEQADEE